MSDPKDPKTIAGWLVKFSTDWLSKTTGLPLSLWDDLRNDSDWLMLIKSHALLETCVNHMLTTHFKIPEASRAFSRLEKSNPKSGKLAFVSACELLSKDMRSFIQKLSEMRNFVVHDIKQYGFSFEAYHESIPQSDRKAWRRIIEFADPPDGSCAEWPRNLKMSIVAGCFWIVMRVFAHDLSSKSKNQDDQDLWKQVSPYFRLPSISTPKTE